MFEGNTAAFGGGLSLLNLTGASVTGANFVGNNATQGPRRLLLTVCLCSDSTLLVSRSSMPPHPHALAHLPSLRLYLSTYLAAYQLTSLLCYVPVFYLTITHFHPLSFPAYISDFLSPPCLSICLFS